MASNHNRKRVRTLRHPFIGEMLGTLGKQTDRSGYGFFRNIWSGFFKHKTTIDTIKNDYNLFRSLYSGSNVGGANVDESMFLGAGFAKPIINSTLAFALGDGFTIKVAGADENPALAAIQEDLEAVKEKEFSKIYDWLKFGTRDGDGFYYVDELGKSTQLKPETVDVVVDAVSGQLIGYNVEEVVEIQDPTTGTKTKYIYLKQYRESWVRVTRMLENETQEQGKIVYERIFVNGEDIDTQELGSDGNPIRIEAFEDEVDKRLLPIVHYRNEPEPGNLYGNSELQNILAFIRNYGEVLDEATKREVYNGKPVLAISGVSKPTDDEDNADQTKKSDTGEDMLDWQQNTTLYLEDSQASAKFLEIPAGMENTGKLLEYLFYNIVQASETPEFVLGTAVSSSKASVSEQMPIVAQKAERKRAQMKTAIIQYLKLHISRQLELSNPVYFALSGTDPEIDIEFPELIDEDKTITKETIELLLTEGVINGETAIEMSVLSNRIEDKAAAVKAGLEDLQRRNDANNVVPEDPNRLEDELDNLDEA